MPWKLPTDLVNESQGLLVGTSKWAYDVTYGSFWALMLFGFCIVLWMAASKYQNDRAFGYASIAGLFGSLMLVTLNLIPWWIASIYILTGAMGIVYMVLNRER